MKSIFRNSLLALMLLTSGSFFVADKASAQAATASAPKTAQIATANPANATTNISYTLTPTLSSDNKTLTLVVSVSNGLAASIAAQTFNFLGTTNETPSRSVSGSATIPALNNAIATPILSVPIPAGLTQTGTLPAGETITNGILTISSQVLDGTQAVSLATTFSTGR